VPTQTAAPKRGIRVINVAPPEKIQPPAELALPAGNASLSPKFPRGGVTIKILEPSFPAPPAAVNSDVTK
jgi:hypothetical protein